MWVEVKQSNNLLAFIISVHGLALTSSMFLAILMSLKLLLMILVCYSLYFHLRRYRQGFYILTLKHTAEFAWELEQKNNLKGISILNTSVLTSFIIILHVQTNKQHRNLLICRDAVSDEAYRQLLVALKITAANNSSYTRQ